MKLIFPAAGLLAGFLLGHGAEMSMELLLLIASIVFTYAGIGVLALKRDSDSSTVRARSSAPTSRHA